MTEKQLARLYEIACAGATRRPDEDQFEVWKRTLGRFDESEVSTALSRWQSDVREVMHFDELRPRGATMPTAADLLSLLLKTQRQRQEENKFQACGIDGCSEGYRLEYRDTEVGGKGVKTRVAAKCSCLQAWTQCSGPARPTRVPTTLDADLIALKSLRRVQ